MSKIVVITGAGSGLGRALARRFGRDGDQVVLLGRTLAKLEKVAAELGEGAMAVQCDVGDLESVRAAFARIAERHPRIDVLINNAAYIDVFLIAEGSDEQILKTVNTNLLGPMICSRAAINMMGRGGHIINVTSEGVDFYFPHHVAYVATKGGVETFSKHLRLELEPRGIRVTVARAGQMLDDDRTWDADPAAIQRFFQAASEAGVDLMKRPISPFDTVTGVFRSLVDQPPEVQVTTVQFVARTPD